MERFNSSQDQSIGPQNVESRKGSTMKSSIASVFISLMQQYIQQYTELKCKQRYIYIYIYIYICVCVCV